MNKTLKKAISIILTILMVVTGVPFAFAVDTPVAKIGDVEYTDFDEALSNWVDNTTLTLLADVTDLTETITTTAKGLTLDLNGHTLASADTWTLRVWGASELTIRDSKGNGNINGSVIVGWTNDGGPGTLLLESGTLEEVGVSGIFTMTGGTIKNESSAALDVNNDTDTVLITGGEIYGSTYGIWITSGNVTISGDTKITGAGQYAIQTFDCSVVVSGTPTISGGAGEFNLGSKITLNTQPANGEVWRVKIDTEEITDGIFAVPGEGITLDIGKFASAMDGYEVKQNAKGELLLCNHTEQTAASNGDGTHNTTCNCGEATFDTNVACSGGVATDTHQAYCEYCNAPYGEVNPDVHYDIFAVNMTAEQLQSDLLELLNAGNTDISIVLAAKADEEMFTAINTAFCSSTAAAGSVNLTIAGAQTVSNITVLTPDGPKIPLALKTLTLPGATALDMEAIMYVSNLEAIYLPNVTSISAWGFDELNALNTLVLSAEGAITFRDFNTIGLPFANIDLTLHCNKKNDVTDGTIWQGKTWKSISFAHSWTDGTCADCGEVCPHESYTDGVCDVCGFECHHENQKGAVCEVCGKILHVDEDGNEFCDDCGTLIGAKVLTSDGGYLYIDGVKAETTGSRQLLPTGNYIPAGNITTSYNIYVENGESVTLDLNGYTWYSNILSVYGAFSLYDTSENETGKITSNDEAYTISVTDYGQFSLYSGAVENINAGSDACAVDARANASINLYGGKLKSKVHAVYYSLYSDVTINLDGTVLECGDSHPQFVADGYIDAPATSVIDVTDYKGGKLAVEIDNSSTTDKITVFTGISSAQEAENYTVQDAFKDDCMNISIEKTEYDEATGELSVYLGESTFTQQPTSENNYTVDFNTLDASFLWHEIETPILTSDNVTASAVFENGKWLCGAGKYIKLFTFDAKAGDILEISSNSSEEFSLDINNEDWTLEENIDITESGSFTVSEDAKLTVWVNAYNVSEDLEIEFSILRIIEELDSETGKTLQNPECLKTYSCQATTKKGYVCSSDAVTVAHNWANLDGICVNGCGTECAHQNETGAICSVCGAALHTCDFSGEWKYDADKHWKECTVDGCSKISEDADHSFADGKCACGYTCPHGSYTNGICDKCDYECPHEWGEGVLTRPHFNADLGFFEDGYYTYTCTLCGHSYTEPTKKADTTALNDTYMKVIEYCRNDTLTQEAIDKIDKSYRDIVRDNGNIFDELGFVRYELIEEDQPIIDEITEELQKIIDEADEKIASGEYVKADYTAIDEAIDDIEEKLASENVTDEGKAELEEIKTQLEEMKADENTSAADVAELEKALEDYEEELDKGIEDGTLVEVDGDKLAAESNKKFAEKLEAEGLLDEYKDFIDNQKATDEALAAIREVNDLLYSLEGTVAENAENIAKINEMMDYILTSWENCLRGTHNFNDYEITSPAKCEVNAIETGTCWFCGETDEREVEGTALSHSFTKYEEFEAPKCGVAGKEISYCDNGCQTTDEREIPALEHIFLDYVSNGDATCTADGTKTAECERGCGATDTVADENSKLDHTDEDGDKVCDDCEAEIIDVCPDCGRPVHDDKGIPQYICLIIAIFNIIVSLIEAIS